MKRRSILIAVCFLASSLLLLMPVNAKKQETIWNAYTVAGDPLYIYLDNHFLPNGNMKWDAGINLLWQNEDGTVVYGEGEEYIKGIQRFEKGKNLCSLVGWGVFHGAGGDIYYRFTVNSYLGADPDTRRYSFANHITIWKGTGIYEGIHGYGVIQYPIHYELHFHIEP